MTLESWTVLARRSALSTLLAALALSCGKDDAAPGPGAAGSSAASGGSTEAGGTAGAATSSGGTSGTAAGRAGAANTGGAGNTAGTAGSAGTRSGNGGSGASGGSAEGGAGTEAGATNGGSPNAGSPGGGNAGADAGSSGAAGAGGAVTAWTPSFETTILSPDHYAEGADVGDIDGDGVLDLVAGPIWYAGPDFAVGGRLFDPVPTFSRDNYSTFFLTFVDDLNGDGNPDVIGIGDAGGGNGTGNPNAFWYQNPGPNALDQAWTKRPIFDGLVANESPAFANLLGDAKKELVFMTNRQLGYATPGASPNDPWTFHAVSGSTFNTPYVHGLGVGDIDGDGRADIVERSGWWQQPSGAGAWTQHTVDFGAGLTGTRANNWGGSEMIVYDVDGDGDSNVVTVLAAHQYGLSWFEQVNADTFTPHAILPPSAGAGNVSQLHAMAAGDLNGDGLLDVVTGKRYYAHPAATGDPGTTDPPIIEWFELSRTGGVSFTPHQIHAESGVGCNFAIRDVTGEGKPDIFVTNKHGTFLHAQR